MDRREFLKATGLTALCAPLPVYRRVLATSRQLADHTIRIGTALVEGGRQRFLSMTAYDGRFPGPLLRFKEGRKAIVDVYNDTDTAEQLHWHGQLVPDSVDGAAEERTPWIPPHGVRRVAFVPGPSGFRFYHTHVRAGSNLDLGQYGGEVGPVYIEPAQEPGAHGLRLHGAVSDYLTGATQSRYFAVMTGAMPSTGASPSRCSSRRSWP